MYEFEIINYDAPPSREELVAEAELYKLLATTAKQSPEIEEAVNALIDAVQNRAFRDGIALAHKS